MSVLIVNTALRRTGKTLPLRTRSAPWLLILMLAWGVAAGADHEDLRQAGARHYAAGRYFQAIEAFEKALAVAPEAARDPIKGDLAHAIAGMGFEYISESEGGLAEETFRKAIGISEDYYANFGLGYLYFMRHEDGEARTYLLASLAARDCLVYTSPSPRDRG